MIKRGSIKGSGFKFSLIIILVSVSIIAIIGSIFVHLFLPARLYVDAQFHSALELLESITALFLAILILLLQKDKKINYYYTWIPCALISMSILNAFHAFSPQGNNLVWFHSTAILIGGFLFAMVWLPQRFVPIRSYNKLFVITAIASIILGAFSIIFSYLLPGMLNDGIFTSTARAFNILGGLFFLSSTVYFIIRYRSDHNIEDLIFMNFCLLNGWGGMLFPFSGLWDLNWWFWHLLRLIAYFIAISYIFITFQQAAEALRQYKGHLEELVQKRTADLGITNERLQQEITERRHAEEELRRSQVLLNAINNAQSRFIADSEKRFLFEGLLRDLLLLTGSEYGFIGEIFYNPKGEPYLKTSAITNIAWNGRTREFYKKNAPIGMEFYNTKTLFGPVMTTGKVLISNNPSEDERRGGLPPGHPTLISFLGVPFYQGKKLVGMAGVANRSGGYKEDLVTYLQPLLTTCANIIEAYRSENQRKRGEDELQEAKHRYQRIVEDLPDLICRYRKDTTITFVNEAYATYFGKTVNEIIGTSFLDLIPPKDHEYVVKKIASFNKNSPITSMEHEAINSRGEKRWQSWRDRALFDGSGNITEIQSIGHDITETKLAKEELVHRARLAELGNEISVALSHGESLQNILQLCTESIVRNLDAALARIWIFDQRDEVLELQASAGMYAHIDGGHSRIPIGMYKIGHIAKDRKPHLTNNVIGDPEVHDQEWAIREKMVSFAGYPLIVEDKLVGVMAMFSRQPLTDFSLKALSSVADNIANGIERKKAEKEKERYIEAINKASDGISIADEIDRYIYVNSAYANIFGYSQNDLIGETWRKITPPDLIADVEKGLTNTMHNKNVGVYYGEVPGLRKDGKILPTEVAGTGFWDDTGKYLGHVCIVRDITERKQVEQIIKQSEEKYRDLFENANDAICILDSDLKYKDVNKKTVEMLGYSREELLNMNVYDVIPSEQIPRSEMEFNKLRKNGSYEKFIGRVRAKDGHYIDVEVSSSVIKEGSTVIGSRDIIRDITERVQNEEALRESEERYRTIIEHSNDMIWTMDEEGRFLFFNKRSEEITGSTLMEWVGKSFTPFIENKELPRVMEVFNKTMKGQPQQYEVTVRKMDGKILILSVNSAPIYSKGKIIGTVNFGRDITDRKKIEEQINNSLKEKEVLLSEVYHRVKNNMQIITSLLKLQSRYVADDEYREMFQESLNRIKSMSLVHEKLYESKDLSTIDFKEYVKDIAKGLFQSYGASKDKIALIMDIKNISLDINTAIPCGLIINELVTNSLKHAFPDGKEGKISIAIHSINENTIELIVGDDGAGIPGDVDFKTTKSLGLQLVTMLAENQLHGKIILDRSKGTEFTIKFKEGK